jgi:Holliday junction resolvase RusA-like endonuclease
MSTIVIPGKLANKANAYTVRVQPALWKLIQPTVEQFRKEYRLSPWWVGPAPEVEAYEAEVAYRFLQGERREWTHGEPLQLHIRLIAQRHDCDAMKVIGDGIEKSARIQNDRQFRRIVVEHRDGKAPSVEIEVEPL